MSDTTVTDDSPDQVEPDEQPPASLASRVILWLVFAILYAYPLFEGISNLIALPAVYRAGGAGDAVPWYLLIAGVAAPVILYVGALLLGRGRELFARALMLAAGLAATNALFLGVVQWAQFVQPALK